MSTFLRIQSGSDSLAASTTTKNVVIPSAVVMANTLFIVVFRTQSNTVYANNMTTFQLTSSTQGTIRRDVFGPNIIQFEWYAIEWSAGVNVQRGSTVMNVTTNNGSIAAIDTEKSFPIISSRTGQTTGIFMEHVLTRAYFPNHPSASETQVRFDTFATTGFQTIEWQVVEIDDAVVEQFLGQTAAGTGESLAVDAPDLSKQMLIATFKEIGAGDPSIYKIARYDAVNNVRISSWNASLMDYAIHSVRLPNIRVQRDYFGWSGVSSGYAISSAVEANTFSRSTGGYGSWGIVNNTSNDMNKFSATVGLTAPTTVTMQRYTSDADTVAYPSENIEFVDPSAGFPFLDKVGEEMGEFIGTEYS
jgi:hypothetical protein